MRECRYRIRCVIELLPGPIGSHSTVRPIRALQGRIYGMGKPKALRCEYVEVWGRQGDERSNVKESSIKWGRFPVPQEVVLRTSVLEIVLVQ